MHLQTAFVALVGLASAASIQQPHFQAARRSTELEARQFGKGNTGANKGQAGASATKTNQGTGQAGAAKNSQGAANQGTAITLNPANLQTGSASTGEIQGVNPNGESASQTDTQNFINVCTGKTLTNGLQIKTGSCNGIPMGQIPAQANTISAVINFPKNNDNIQPLTTFNMTATIANIQLGSFTNATSTYYSAPQALNAQGQVIGHTHFVIQDMGADISPDVPVDGTVFAFFRGIDDAGNGKGTVTTAISGGLPAGNYRACTMTSASNHQPVLMAVAQRGAQDDCTRFTVGGGSGNNASGSKAGGGGANNAASATNAGNASNNNNNNNNAGTATAAASSAASASQAATASKGNTGNNAGAATGKAGSAGKTGTGKAAAGNRGN